MIGCALILQCVACWAVYGVRISDLSNSPAPPNPIKVWGKVTSESPLKISDGRAEITVSGLTASLGDTVVVTGNWSGDVLRVSARADVYVGPARVPMIYIPAGSFLMGNNGSEPYSLAWELPQHWVDLSGYYIGKYEVTRGQYRAFMNAGGYSNSSYWSTAGWNWKVSTSRTEPYYWAVNQDWSDYHDEPFTQTDNHPVVGVSYYEAEAFCNWAGGHLPTEAQWEKAARWTGSYPNVYPWGNSWNAEKCNNMGDHNIAAGGGYNQYQTAPVGSYPSGASPYGCQDMAGNVWEWCQDWLKSYPGGSSPFDYTNSCRATRGGGWDNSDVLNVRCAFRSYAPPDYGGVAGFRLAR